MFQLSRGAVALCAALLVVTVVAPYILTPFAELNVPLLPASASEYPWEALANSDGGDAGSSVIVVKDSTSSFNFDFTLSKDRPHPWVSFALAFDDFDNPSEYVDWTRYATLNLTIACVPSNMLSLSLYTVDEPFTDPTDFSTFRNPTVFFKCSEELRMVKIDLRGLDTPDWWLREHDLPLSDQGYQLDKVLGLAIHNSLQSPRQISSSVTIHSANLEGRDWRYLYLAYLIGAAIWSGYLLWVARQYTRIRIERIKEEARKDQPFIPYQQLPAVTRQDKHTSAVLSYLATEYSNPELNVEAVVAALGVSRAKINEILKGERGLTFSAYLNKLRLAEAARLLLEKDASIAEIAYAVGYNNASYFITVFKKEYGCTPKAFKKHMKAKSCL